jgi:hypothetical protein
VENRNEKRMPQIKKPNSSAFFVSAAETKSHVILNRTCLPQVGLRSEELCAIARGLRDESLLKHLSLPLGLALPTTLVPFRDSFA